jgi:hypothetical protein
MVHSRCRPQHHPETNEQRDHTHPKDDVNDSLEQTEDRSHQKPHGFYSFRFAGSQAACASHCPRRGFEERDTLPRKILARFRARLVYKPEPRIPLCAKSYERAKKPTPERPRVSLRSERSVADTLLERAEAFATKERASLTRWIVFKGQATYTFLESVRRVIAVMTEAADANATHLDESDTGGGTRRYLWMVAVE